MYRHRPQTREKVPLFLPQDEIPVKNLNIVPQQLFRYSGCALIGPSQLDPCRYLRAPVSTPPTGRYPAAGTDATPRALPSSFSGFG